ncbi:hypothetical protein DFA_07173 [Cavenderia fasciculata]|uniref:Paramecium surface antigen repeat-containing protein n=1 Tax=Cavenderia fasciculata TaxID=261658 RepID=F4PVP2_CACFS|nr:uncharacterized protein DFA_07173 [Cavenderia fasciculata]EGG20056.1 hypothetical protein DFA_07173 [Cavenderia fasciculata]|eukprot:XP_004367039.1 hypothetical protein DFA_07173 [Cavenderia fasciculata]
MVFLMFTIMIKVFLFILVLASLGLVSNVLSSECSARCVQVGSTCTPEFYYMHGFPVLCADSFCSVTGNETSDWNATCTPYSTEGGTCSKENDDIRGGCQPGLECIYGSRCYQEGYVQYGDYCKNVYECSGMLDCSIKNTCDYPDSSMYGSSIYECDSKSSCPYGSYCNFTQTINSTDQSNITTMICSPEFSIGDECNLSINEEDACPYGSLCNKVNATSSVHRCTRLFSLGLGEPCLYHDDFGLASTCNASQGLYCKRNGVCDHISTNTSTICTDDDDCNIYEVCDCSKGNNGTCVTNYNVNSQCATATMSFYDCLADNRCTLVDNYLNLNSCVASKCGVEYCNLSISCYNTDNDFKCPSPHPINTINCRPRPISSSSLDSSEPSLSPSLSSPFVLGLLLSIAISTFVYVLFIN